MRVLVVDDDDGFANNFIEILKVGCKGMISSVDYIEHFHEAQTIAQAEYIPYDLVFSDTRLGYDDQRNELFGFKLLPLFIERGITSILMSGDNFSHEAKKLGCRFHSKGNLEEQLDFVKEIYNSKYVDE